MGNAMSYHSIARSDTKAGIITNRYATLTVLKDAHGSIFTDTLLRTGAPVFSILSLEYHTTVIISRYYISKVTGTPQRNLGKRSKRFFERSCQNNSYLHIEFERQVPAEVGTAYRNPQKPITFSFFIIILHFGEKAAEMRSFFCLQKCLINVRICVILNTNELSRRE